MAKGSMEITSTEETKYNGEFILKSNNKIILTT